MLVLFLRMEFTLNVEEAGQMVWLRAVVASSRVLLKVRCMLTVRMEAKERWRKLRKDIGKSTLYMENTC